MKGKKILLVDDNKTVMTENSLKFSDAGYEVACALTLIDAHILLEKFKPDAIVLDVMLPDGSGLEFIEELKKGEFAETPVLLLSGLAEQDDIIRGMLAGSDFYLTKPYEFNVLLEKTNSLVANPTKKGKK
ncbi:MAG: response regulator [Defluviitaleaceae bacterium]|nr:response regulator [Defluviitaleaceae bacterium]MCL2261746.1 response regulator [Defluviitaleaceae bacterium]